MTDQPFTANDAAILATKIRVLGPILLEIADAIPKGTTIAGNDLHRQAIRAADEPNRSSRIAGIAATSSGRQDASGGHAR
jgi:hypothetical protein